MQYLKGRIVKLLVDFFEDDFRRIEHTLAVLKEAEAAMGKRSDCDADVVVAAVRLQDGGTKSSERELGCNDGKPQEH